MRKVIKFLYNPFLFYFFLKKLKNFTKYLKTDRILVLDIDNTIADTWKYLGDYKKDPVDFYTKLPVLKGTIQYIYENYQNVPIIFLSNRNIKYYKVTLNWVEQNVYNKNESILILTISPQDKLVYLKELEKKFSTIYFDDLSYNHENDKVLFYKEVIQKVNKMKITYYGYQDIIRINLKDENFN